MTYKTYEEHVEYLKSIVEQGGGRWVAVQDELVLFNSPQTRSTLALPDDEFFTVNAVQEHIRLSNKSFGVNSD